MSARGNVIDLANPITDHGLNFRLAMRLQAMSHIKGRQWPNFKTQGKTYGTLTNFASPMTATSGWVPATHPGGFGSLAFDGTDDRVVVTNFSAQIATATGLSMCGWFIPYTTIDQDVGFMGLRAFDDGAGAFYFDQPIADPTLGEVRFRNGSGTATTIQPSFAAVLDKWTHLAAVFNGTNLIAYINGVDAGVSAAASGTFGVTTIPFNVGYVPYDVSGTYDQYYAGPADDVRFWGRALSPSEVAAVYRDSLAGSPRTLRRLPKTSYFVAEADTPKLSTTRFGRQAVSRAAYH